MGGVCRTWLGVVSNVCEDEEVCVQQAMMQTLNDIGYETVMNSGTNIVNALQRASPATTSMSKTDRIMTAERIYVQSIFGCMAKHVRD